MHLSQVHLVSLHQTTLNLRKKKWGFLNQHLPVHGAFCDGDILWTMTSRGHYFSKWVTSRGNSQRVTFRGHFWLSKLGIILG